MKNKGFTLIEVIVSVLMISMVSVGVMFAITLSLNSANKIRNSMIAANLAQEGLEVVRNIRDQDWHSGRPFGTSLPNGIYLVASDSQSLIPFSDTFLKKGSGGLYKYSSGPGAQDTIFKRKVIIENSSQNPATVEKVVKVEVSWQEKSGPQMVQVEARLFDWR